MGIGFGPALPVYPVKVTLSPRRDEGKVKSGEEVEERGHTKKRISVGIRRGWKGRVKGLSDLVALTMAGGQ